MKEKVKDKRREDREKRRERTRREKKQDKMKKRDKMKRREKKEKMVFFFFKKNVSRPSNPPDELAQHVSKKNPRRTIYSSIFPSKVQNLAVFQLFT